MTTSAQFDHVADVLASLTSKAADALDGCGDAALSGATTSLVTDLARGALTGKLSPSEVAENAASAAAQSAATGVIEKGLHEVAVRTLGKQAFKKVAGHTASAAAKNALKSNAVGQAASLLVGQSVDTFRLVCGDIDGREYGKRTAENAGDAAGGLGGSALGAAIGTLIFPGVGTAAGSVIGGLLGSLGGGAAIRKITRD